MPRADLEADVRDDPAFIRIVGITERDVLKLDFTAGCFEFSDLDPFLNCVVTVENGEKAGAASRGPSEGVYGHPDLPYGHVQDHHECQELGQCADGDLTGHDLCTTHPQHRGHGGIKGKAHEGHAADPGHQPLKRDLQYLYRQPIELCQLMNL